MSSKDKRYLIKLPLRAKIDLWLGSSKVLIYISQLIPSVLFSGLIVILLIVGYVKSNQSIKLFSNPDFAGLFGTLIGVFVGAFIGGIISLQLHKESLRATSAIKDKEHIYTVLYDGLSKFSSEIKKDKYSLYFTLSLTDVRINTMNPKFVEWDRIKNDSRIVQVPKWLRVIFEHYLEQFNEYQELIDRAIADIIAEKTDLLKEINHNYRVVPGLDESYLHGILAKSKLYLSHGINLDEDDAVNFDMSVIEQKAVDRCSSLPSIHRIISFYESVLIKNTDELMLILELVIRYINNKYENQDDVI